MPVWTVLNQSLPADYVSRPAAVTQFSTDARTMAFHAIEPPLSPGKSPCVTSGPYQSAQPDRSGVSYGRARSASGLPCPTQLLELGDLRAPRVKRSGAGEGAHARASMDARREVEP